MTPPAEHPTRAPARPLPYVVVGILLAAGIVLPLVVPSYAPIAPALGGIPSFYWSQVVWVAIEAAILYACYRVLRAEERRRRAAAAQATVSSPPEAQP